MTKAKKFSISALVVVVPVVLLAYSSGPDPKYTGAPGENTCTQCHGGTALNGGGGKVSASFSTGTNYTPGQVTHVTLTVSDPKNTHAGFQMAAKTASGANAGDFTAGSGQQVLCPSGSGKSGASCPGNGVEYIEHDRPSSSMTWTFDWTAPSTDVGTVTFYFAGNAVNLNGQDTGDHVYTSSATLTAAAGGGGDQKPTVAQNGVVSAAAFGGFATFGSGSWLEIYGTFPGLNSQTWAGSDFSRNNAPTSLAGVSVKVNNKLAYIDFISAGQINVQAPDDDSTGPVQLVVTTPGGSSDAFVITKVTASPGVLAPASFIIGGKQYVVAQHADGTYVGPPAGVPGVTMSPARPGETVVIYGIGWGAPTNAGTIVQGTANLANEPTFAFNQTAATLVYGGPSPGFVGLYQFNVTVPNVADSNVVPLKITVPGSTVAQTSLFTAVHN